jgi:hypothetical protein
MGDSPSNRCSDRATDRFASRVVLDARDRLGLGPGELVNDMPGGSPPRPNCGERDAAWAGGVGRAVYDRAAHDRRVTHVSPRQGSGRPALGIGATGQTR